VFVYVYLGCSQDTNGAKDKRSGHFIYISSTPYHCSATDNYGMISVHIIGVSLYIYFKDYNLTNDSSVRIANNVLCKYIYTTSSNNGVGRSLHQYNKFNNALYKYKKFK